MCCDLTVRGGFPTFADAARAGKTRARPRSVELLIRMVIY